MILKILLIDMIIVAIFMFLVILGSNIDKTDRENEIEDKEQMEYLRKYKSSRQKNNRKNSKK